MKSEISKIKEGMVKNTNLFVKGKRSKKVYEKVDDNLHKRLFKALKKK